ncbi:MAG TPA: amino acid adenylation domain-containing protein [Thermoanaerobaculia bacterium]|nr:amino acid adenylation domain-containing protein [Thermoanaerobaculia bacterium]
MCQADAAMPFDLAKGPLLRGKVIRLAEDEHILMLNMHHIIGDGWSLGILIRELGMAMKAFRAGRRPELPPLPIQYADYAVWQRRWLEQGGVLEKQLVYWREKLAGVPESLDLAFDYPRPAVQSFAGGHHSFALDGQLTRQLKRLAEGGGATLYMVLVAAFKVLLQRYTGQNDICIGSPIANRQYGETEGVIGMFVNMLALRSEVEADDSFAAFLSKVRATCLEAYEHQDAPFARVVDLLHQERNLAITPLFQVTVILQNTDRVALDPSMELYPIESGISKFDLSVEFTETPEGLAGAIEYSTALYKPQTIVRMAGHFLALCRSIAATPTARIRDLAYFGGAEKRTLLADFNDTAADYPLDQCIHHLFERQAARNAAKTAVVCGEERLTYRQLSERSHDLALYLQSQGVEPDRLVGVCMERSLDMVVALFGILEAGGAYVPLDPDYPDERLAHMVRDSGAGIVLTQEALREHLATLVAADTQLIALDGQWPEISERVNVLKAASVALRQEVEPHHLAYVIYTSGSTGRPKGVMNEHRGVVNRLLWMQDAYGLGEEEAVLQKTPFSFDVSVWEFFWTLSTGATLVMARPEGHKDPAYLVDTIRRHGITTLHFVPPMLQVFLEHEEARQCVSLKRVVCSGEALPSALVRRFAERLPHAVLYNLYGPTEAAVDVTAWTCPATDIPNAIPIGRPIANTQIYILDRHGAPVPVGVAGELHIAGVQVARGYLNRPELTAERFVIAPFAADAGARMYKTGDLARWLDDGTIEYLGRMDTQVKLRGFRIELGEIEAQLNQHFGIQDAVVIAQGEGAIKQLIAFYRAKETTVDEIVELPNEELREHLLRTLPSYMVPAALISLEAIPLSPNGKVDRRALARIDVTMASERGYVAPRNETEQRLVAIWAEVLNRAPESIGVHDNFFELGGHSLSAVQLMAKVNRHFKQMLPLAVLFTAPDVAALAKLISSEKAPSFDILVPIQPHGDAPPVFAVPGAGGNVLSLRPLGQSLGDQQPLFALQAVGLDGKTPPLDSVEQTAQANIAALKTVQPSGPYRLVGHSYGGVVAYEMARILLEQGEEISSLILVDSLAPSVMRGNPVHDEVGDLVEACQAVADLNGAKLEIDLEKLRRSTLEERVRYLVGLLNDRGLEINSEQLTAFYRVYQTNMLCYRAYTPSLLPRTIDVSLYRATQVRSDRQNLPRDYGWDELLPSPIRASDVQADHFSILAKVPIQDVGRAVHASIATATDVPAAVRAI